MVVRSYGGSGVEVVVWRFGGVVVVRRCGGSGMVVWR